MTITSKFKDTEDLRNWILSLNMRDEEKMEELGKIDVDRLKELVKRRSIEDETVLSLVQTNVLDIVNISVDHDWKLPFTLAILEVKKAYMMERIMLALECIAEK